MKYHFKNIIITASILFVIFFMLSCGSNTKSKADGFEIKGKIGGLKEDSVYLYNTLTNSFVSTAAVRNDTFSFNGKLGYPEMYQIYFDSSHNLFTNIFLENSKITVSGNVDQLDSIKITGSNVHTEYLRHRFSIKTIIENLDSLVNQINVAQQKSEFDISDSLEAIYNSLSLIRLKMVFEFTKKNKNSLIIPYITSRSVMDAPDKDAVDKIFAAMDKANMDNPRIKKVYEVLTDLHKAAISTIAPDFVANSNKGTLIKLSSFKNKVVLLDFWASWCKPCRLSHPGLVKIYNKFKNKDFEMISFSIDTKEDLWKQAIAKDGLTWTQVVDLNGAKGKTLKDYGIYFVPTTYLIDKNGKIVAKNIHGNKLDAEITKLTRL